jgi:predicted transcriptional regulator
VNIALRLQGLPLGRLAQVLGLGRTTLYEWLSGKTRPNLEDANRLRFLLGLEAAEPVSSEEPRTRSW